MKFLVVSVLIISLFDSLYATELSPWLKYKELSCTSEIKKILEERNDLLAEFRTHISSAPSLEVYRAPSRQKGEWLEIHFINKTIPEMFIIGNNELKKISFNDQCLPKIQNENWPFELEKVLKNKTAQDWNNDLLYKLVDSGKKGWIYSWSPRFVYSVLDMPRVEKLAYKFGYEFIPVVDPRASHDEVLGALKVMQRENNAIISKELRKLASEESYLRNTSTDLYMRNGFNHFPIIYVYNNGKIHSRFITGVMTEKGLKSMANTFSTELSSSEKLNVK